MVEKSAEAFRTISEVAEEIGVPQHVLRFWETRFPAVKPLKRGGNRRYYRPEDVQLLHAINRLLYADGYTIKGVQKLLKEKGIKGLVAPQGEAAATVPEPVPVAAAAQVVAPAAAIAPADAAFLASLVGIRDRLSAALADARAS